jgi:signal peptidase I
MIKEIDQTGMKYLCKRKFNPDDETDHLKYKGSGVLWRRILKAHPEYTIKTTVLGLFSKEELKCQGLYYSELYNIVDDPQWANFINEVGDGGDTSNTPGYVEALKKRKPDPLNGKRKTIHNPITGEVRRILPEQSLPEGFVWGNCKGKGFGPRKGDTVVYHNGKRKIYVPKNQNPPAGFERGLHYQGTTKGRVGYFNPKTGHKTYIYENEDPPPGYVKGLPPTTGKLICTPYGVYNSVQECMRSLNLTRYQIIQNIKHKEGWNYESSAEIL